MAEKIGRVAIGTAVIGQGPSAIVDRVPTDAVALIAPTAIAARIPTATLHRGESDLRIAAPVPAIGRARNGAALVALGVTILRNATTIVGGARALARAGVAAGRIARRSSAFDSSSENDCGAGAIRVVDARAKTVDQIVVPAIEGMLAAVEGIAVTRVAVTRIAVTATDEPAVMIVAATRSRNCVSKSSSFVVRWKSSSA